MTTLEQLAQERWRILVSRNGTSAFDTRGPGSHLAAAAPEMLALLLESHRASPYTCWSDWENRRDALIAELRARVETNG